MNALVQQEYRRELDDLSREVSRKFRELALIRADLKNTINELRQDNRNEPSETRIKG